MFHFITHTLLQFTNRLSVILLRVDLTIKSAVIIGIHTRTVQLFDKESYVSKLLVMVYVTSHVQVKTASMTALTVNHR